MATPMPPRGPTTQGSKGGRPFLWIGIAVAGVAGYYLYQSKGDASVAAHKAESDARKLRERGLDGAESIGAKIDRGFDDAKSKANDSYASAKREFSSEWQKAEQKGQKLGSKMENLVDRVDSKTDEAAAKTKQQINNVFRK